MQIITNRMLIILSANFPHTNEFKIKLYPTENLQRERMIDDVGKFYLNVSDIVSDVDVISMVSEIIGKTCERKNLTLESISPYFDGISNVYGGFNNCIVQYKFKSEDLMKIGKIEKNLIKYDLRYNFTITVSTLLIIEALHYVREVFKWKELWAEFV